MLTKEEFEKLPPFHRGYMVYMFGNRDDEPNVAVEENPYPSGSTEWNEWNRGHHSGVLVAQDSEE